MHEMLFSAPPAIDVSEDAIDVEEDRGVDGLGVLRAVVGAWQDLIIENGAANAG